MASPTHENGVFMKVLCRHSTRNFSTDFDKKKQNKKHQPCSAFQKCYFVYLFIVLCPRHEVEESI